MSETLCRVTVSKPKRNAVPDRYIVTLKPNCDLKSHLDWVQGQAIQLANTDSQCEVIREYDFINAYGAKLSGSALENLTQRDDVESIVGERVGTLDVVSR